MTELFQRLEDDWAAIVAKRDVEVAESFLADDFVLMSEGGVAPEMPREAWLRSLPSIDTRSLGARVLGVREYGDTAIVWARLTWEAQAGARDLSGEYAVTDVFTSVDGHWRPSWRSSVRLGSS